MFPDKKTFGIDVSKDAWIGGFDDDPEVGDIPGIRNLDVKVGRGVFIGNPTGEHDEFGV